MSGTLTPGAAVVHWETAVQSSLTVGSIENSKEPTPKSESLGLILTVPLTSYELGHEVLCTPSTSASPKDGPEDKEVKPLSLLLGHIRLFEILFLRD